MQGTFTLGFLQKMRGLIDQRPPMKQKRAALKEISNGCINMFKRLKKVKNVSSTSLQNTRLLKYVWEYFHVLYKVLS